MNALEYEIREPELGSSLGHRLVFAWSLLGATLAVGLIYEAATSRLIGDAYAPSFGTIFLMPITFAFGVCFLSPALFALHRSPTPANVRLDWWSVALSLTATVFTGGLAILAIVAPRTHGSGC